MLIWWTSASLVPLAAALDEKAGIFSIDRKDADRPMKLTLPELSVPRRV
jgi:hypothetical protein